ADDTQAAANHKGEGEAGDGGQRQAANPRDREYAEAPGQRDVDGRQLDGGDGKGREGGGQHRVGGDEVLAHGGGEDRRVDRGRARRSDAEGTGLGGGERVDDGGGHAGIGESGVDGRDQRRVVPVDPRTGCAGRCARQGAVGGVGQG